MFPFFRHAWIFRSRWVALLWAAGICWMAVELVGSAPEEAGNNSAATDITGAGIAPEDVKRIEESLKKL
jgi:hypothetical protein